MEKRKHNALVFYSRVPNKHLVGKTRIGNVIENQDLANEFARSLILDMLHEFTPSWADNYDLIFYHKGSKTFFHDRRNLHIKNFIEQPAIHLGDSMTYIHKKLLDYYDRVIIVGSDIPFLRKKDICKAFHLLKQKDIVIAPAEDFGYGLIGMRTFIDVYSNIKNWESRSEGYILISETLALAKKQNASIALLDHIYDIDTIDDIKRLYTDITNKRGDLLRKYNYLSRTYQFLKEHLNTFLAYDKHSDTNVE